MALFSYYEGKAGTSEEAGDAAANQQTTYATLQTNLDTRSAAAADETQYDITDPVATATRPAENSSTELGAAALLASGAIKHFASAIRTYDGHIDDLNAEYETAKSHDFYAESADGEGEEPTQGEIDSAGADLRARLETERQGYEDTLNESADYAGGLLGSGPTDSALLSLYLLGDISAADASEALGLSIAVLNNMRMAAATSNFVLTTPKWMPQLTQYLLHVNPKLIQGRIDMQVAMHIRQITQMSQAQGLSFAQRVAAYKQAKIDAATWAKIFGKTLRGEAMVSAATPGHLFGKYGANSKWFGPISKWAGRILSPAAVVVGGVGLYNTIDDWDQLATDEKINGVVGNSAFMVSGGLGTAAMVAGALGMAFPPALAAVAIGAGVVALGSMVYQYREEIWDGIKWTGGKIADAATWVYDNTGLDTAVDNTVDFVEDAGEVISDGWDAITPW